MTYSHQRYNELVERTFAEVKKLGELKGREYAHGDDRLDNFRRHAEAMNVPMELVWYIYANKHWDAVTQYVRDIVTGTIDVTRLENIESRLDDIITYCLLMRAIVEERTQPGLITNDLVEPKSCSLGENQP